MTQSQSPYPARDILSAANYVKSFIGTFEQRCLDYEAQLALGAARLTGAKNQPHGVTHQERLQIWDRMVEQTNPAGRLHDTAQPVADPAPHKLWISAGAGVAKKFNHHIVRGSIQPVQEWVQRPYATEDKLAVSLALQQQRIELRVAAELEKMRQENGKWRPPVSRYPHNKYGGPMRFMPIIELINYRS